MRLKDQIMNATRHRFSSKIQVSVTAVLTRAAVYKQSQLGAAVDYLLIK